MSRRFAGILAWKRLSKKKKMGACLDTHLSAINIEMPQ